jgi:multidrug efflux pump subunit AcrA (membrane-fusion protein)
MNWSALAAAIVFAPFSTVFAQSNGIPVQFVQVTLLNESDLAAPDAGRCFELPAAEGQHVKRGDLLIRLDDTQEKIGVDRATTELQITQMKAVNSISIDIARKANGAAKSKLKRSEESRVKYPKSIPEEVIEELQFLTDKTESEISQAEFDLELAKKNAALAASELELAQEKLDRRQVRSPFNGVVVEVLANEGEWVEAGQKLARVVRLDRLRVTGFVPSKYLPDELIGREAEFTAIREGRENVTLKLKIEYVSPEANPVSGERRLWVEIDNRDGHLFPGMQAKLEILPATPK